MSEHSIVPKPDCVVADAGGGEPVAAGGVATGGGGVTTWCVWPPCLENPGPGPNAAFDIGLGMTGGTFVKS